jgi:glycosyltransferase involved in cell wall biosynthesis
MNILILNWRDPKHPNAGGAEIVTREHAKAWSKAGHNVTWFSSFFQGAKEKEILDRIEIIRKGDQVFGVQFHVFLWYLFGKHKKYDLVIDQFHGIPFFTPLYVPTKKLAFIHEVTKNVWKFNPWPKPFNIIPYIIGTIIEPWIFKLFYSKIPFLTVSQSTKDELIKWGIKTENISVIHNGTSYSVLQRKIEKNTQKTIMFLGALAHDKGIEDALRVFGVIASNESEWKFWVVGKGDPEYIRKLKIQADELHIKNITFFGYVSEAKKFELLRKAHILINPSVREGWGLVNIEANTVGTPVVAYDVSGCRDSIKNGNTGIIVKEGDYKAMADVCIELVMNTKNYKKISTNALNWSKRFRWHDATNKSLTLISKNYKVEAKHD